MRNSYQDAFYYLVFLEETSFRHGCSFSDAAVVVFAAAVFASEHGLGAGFVLLELQVLVDGEGMGHGLYVEVVGADECEGPILFLQFLYHLADHLQRPFFATVLLTVGDDGHQRRTRIFPWQPLRSSIATHRTGKISSIG